MPLQDSFKVKVINVRLVMDSGWVVAQCLVDGESQDIGFVGVQESDDPLESGSTYRCTGERKYDPKWGEQIKFTSYIMSTPGQKVGMVKYLQQLPKIGEATAEKLWSLYRSDAVANLRDPSRHEMISRQTMLSMEVLNLAKSKLDRLDDDGMQETMIELMELFDRIGFPKKMVNALLRDHGVRAAAWVRANPFRLMGYGGAGFSRCDRLYLREGGNERRIRRHAYGIVDAIQNDIMEGHIWHERALVVRTMKKKITNMRMDIAEKFGVKIGLLAVREVDGKRCIALKTEADAEAYVAKDLAQRAEYMRATWREAVAAHSGLSEHQEEQVAKATRGRVGALVGGPGVGKTYCLARILRQLPHGENETAICCPTGKAARRAKEALVDAGINDITPRTIHSTLGASFDAGKFEFRHDEKNKLPIKYCVVDETSMCDIELFASLLKALKPDTHLLLIGDHNQLSPVGPGCPLRDIIDSPQIPTGELTEVRRNSGKIVECCHRIRTDADVVLADHIDESVGDNITLVECINEEEQHDAILSLLENVHGEGYDPIDDVYLITPRNKGGLITRQKLNHDLQNYLNSNQDGRREPNMFLVGDPCICLRNHEATSVLEGRKTPRRGMTARANSEYKNSGTAFVVNGQQGKVVAVRPSFTIVRLEDDRLVRVGSRKNGEPIDWDLAYALTCHKSQGSEAPVAIVVIDASAGGKLVSSRSWLYTAVSRARNRCYIVGRLQTMKNMLVKDDARARRTDLVRMIADEVRHASI